MDWDPITHYKDVEIAEKYDRERFSSLPGRAFNALEQANMRRAFRDVPRGAVVMDLPCGTGRFAEVLLDEGFRVVGVDISAAMLEVAKRKLVQFGERFSTLVADVRELAQRGEKLCDVALCARVLMHFPLAEQITFLRGVAQLSRGRVVLTHSLSTPYQRSRRSVKRKVFGTTSPAAYPITDAEMQQLVAGAGLREVRRIRPMPLISEAIYVIAEPI